MWGVVVKTRNADARRLISFNQLPSQTPYNEPECHTASCCIRGIPYMIVFAKQSLLFATQSQARRTCRSPQEGLGRPTLRGELADLERGEDDAARNENGA
jgi:hypothetical protein